MAIQLSDISANVPKPPIIIIHGDPGIGKTTFCASAPSPVFIKTEDGLGSLSVDSFPLAVRFEEVMEELEVLRTQNHQYETVVVDSLDWMEPLIWSRVCEDHGVAMIEAIGYGRGYVDALTYWRKFIDALKGLRDSGMLVILTAHSAIVKVEDPTAQAYDTRNLKLHKRAAPLFVEFGNVILYAQLKTTVVSEDTGFGNMRLRATTSGDRIMHTIGQPAFLAKNQYGLPPVLPLAWDSFADAMWGGEDNA